ncbi:MAG: FRG domain-containing protein [Phycisphaerales bacterium JB041]
MQISFDGLIPSAFRSVTASNPATWDESGIRLRPPLDHLSGALRSILHSRSDALREVALSFFRDAPILASTPKLAMSNVTLSKGLAEFHPGTNVLRSHLRLIALAQHYEHGSSMVDVTRSPDIAAWFASHTWNDGQPTGTRNGVGSIYRFNSHALETMISDRLLWADNVHPWLQGLGLFGIVDISSFEPDIAARPAAQLGGSVLGLENSAMYFLMGAYSVGEVFTFPHASVTGSEVGLSRSALCPSGDPASHILRTDGGDQAPIAPEELRGMLSAAGMSRSEVDHLVTLREAELL